MGKGPLGWLYSAERLCPLQPDKAHIREKPVSRNMDSLSTEITALVTYVRMLEK